MRRTFLLIFIATESVCIFFLALRLYLAQQEGRVLGAVSVNPLRFENLNISTDSATAYYYDLKPNMTERAEISRIFPFGKSLMPILGEQSWGSPDVTYTINADGLNALSNYSPKVQPGTYRIISLGDSFTFGWHVNTSANYSEQLQDLLNSRLRCNKYERFEVINLGVPGYDLDLENLRYQLKGAKYSPDLIVWHIVDNDFWDYQRGQVKLYLQYFADPDLQRQYHGDAMLIWNRATDDAAKLYGGEEAMKNYQYSRLLEFIMSHPEKILLVTPSATRDIYKSLIKQASGLRQSVRYFEIPSAYELLPDKHPSAAGHKFIATQLFGYLQKTYLSDCTPVP